MKVLWITNILFPEAISLITKQPAISRSGGWMIGAAKALVENKNNMNLSVATITNLVDDLVKVDGAQWSYYALPYGKGAFNFNDEYEKYWKRIEAEYKPDVVHIHGTELSLGLSFVNACGADNVVVSIQGLTSVICNYYEAGMSRAEIIKSMTPRDIIRGSILKDKWRFEQRGLYEIELLRKVHHVIGRTHWDRSHVWAINPEAHYYYCNETLQPPFYEGRWEYAKCIPHSIFVSQASYPLKGFHQLLKALPLVIKQYPDVKVNVAGTHREMRSFSQRKNMSGYENYLNKLISKLDLEEHVNWLGALDVLQMKHEYLSANVFISPSSIENSPNSVCEAQMLGTPVIASYVGGTMDLIPNESCGYLYRFEDIEMLAHLICTVFAKSLSFDNTIMQATSRDRHNGIANSQILQSIYTSVS